MSRKRRKQWLLDVWDFHHGHLKPERMAEVRKKIEEEVDARSDSEKVNQIINELRQAGRWETHPDFPGQMIDRILDSESRGMGAKFLVVVVVTVVGWLVYSSLSGTEESAPPSAPVLRLESAPPEPTRTTVQSATQDHTGKVSDNLFDVDGQNPIGTGDAPVLAAPTPPRGMGTRLQLKDPVPNAEGDLDEWMPGAVKREDF